MNHQYLTCCRYIFKQPQCEKTDINCDQIDELGGSLSGMNVKRHVNYILQTFIKLSDSHYSYLQVTRASASVMVFN